jgi:hypothetical protein
MQTFVEKLYRRSDTGIWLQHFFSLSFLSSDEVELGFVKLMSIAPPDVTNFNDYILDNYVFEDTKLPKVFCFG